MACLDLEGAVVGPQVDRVSDARNSALKDLRTLACAYAKKLYATDHLCSFGSSDGELQIRILLPVTEKKRELQKEAIIGVANSCDSLWTRVAVQPTLKGLCSTDELLPVLKVVGILHLQDVNVLPGRLACAACYSYTHNFGVELSDLGTLVLSSSIVEVRHGV